VAAAAAGAAVVLIHRAVQAAEVHTLVEAAVVAVAIPLVAEVLHQVVVNNTLSIHSGLN
jgi:hypothetical protein